MKPHQLFGSALVFCVLFLSFEPCHAQTYSPEFQSLLNQIQQNYLAPKGENISVLRSQYPEVMAALVGHALRQQAIHAQQDPSLNNQFTNLQRDAQVFITDVARTTSARMQDGSPYPPDGLWYIVDRVYQGQEEDWIWQNFRVKSGTMPSVMAARSGPQAPAPPVGRPLMTKEEKDEIDLLGRVAPPVTGPPAEQRPQPTPQRQITLNPDGIQGGNWTGNGGKTQLRIWKQGDLYLGSMSGETEMLYYYFKPNEVCLRLKYVGKGEKGLIFKGTFYRMQSGFSQKNPYAWSDITFFYYSALGKERFDTHPEGVGTNFRR
jgi:hypothetical protein